MTTSRPNRTKTFAGTHTRAPKSRRDWLWTIVFTVLMFILVPIASLVRYRVVSSESIIAGLFMASTLPLAIAVSELYPKKNFLKWFQNAMALIFFVPLLLYVFDYPLIYVGPTFYALIFFMCVSLTWLQFLREEKYPYQTVWLPQIQWKVSKWYLFFALVAVVSYFLGQSFLTETQLRWLSATAAFYSLFVILGAFFFVQRSEDLWKYCKSALIVLRDYLKHLKEEEKREVEGTLLEKDLTIFPVVIKNANRLIKNLYPNSPIIARPYTYYRALYVSVLSGEESRHKDLESGIETMLDAFTTNGLSFSFDLYRFAKGLNTVAGVEPTYSNIVKIFEEERGVFSWIKKNAKIIQIAVSLLTAIVAFKELSPYIVTVLRNLLAGA